MAVTAIQTPSTCMRAQDAGLLAKMGGKAPPMSPQDIIEFIFFPVVNEGCRVVAEGIVDKPADLDVATVLAMGFPPYRCARVSFGSCVASTSPCCILHYAQCLAMSLSPALRVMAGVLPQLLPTSVLSVFLGVFQVVGVALRFRS